MTKGNPHIWMDYVQVIRELRDTVSKLGYSVGLMNKPDQDGHVELVLLPVHLDAGDVATVAEVLRCELGRQMVAANLKEKRRESRAEAFKLQELRVSGPKIKSLHERKPDHMDSSEWIDHVRHGCPGDQPNGLRSWTFQVGEGEWVVTGVQRQQTDMSWWSTQNGKTQYDPWPAYSEGARHALRAPKEYL